MKNLKKLSLIVAIIMVAAIVSSCAGTKTPPSESTSPSSSAEPSQSAGPGEEKKILTEEEVGPKHIVLLIKNKVNAFFVQMAEAVEEQCAEYGWTCEVLAPITSDSNEEQIQLLEQSLLDPPDGYLIVPADSQGITPAIEQINEAGIPIVNVNTQFYDEDIDYITYVGIENYKLAYSAIEAINKRFDKPGNALLIEGVTGAQTSIDRTNGATDAFRDLGWNLLASQTANYNRSEAVEVTQNLLQAYDDVDVIFAASGEMGLGAAIAIEQAGRQDEIFLGCINCYEEIIQAVVDGRIHMTADDDSRLQGQVGVQCMMKYFQGYEQEKITYIDSTVIDESNIDIYKERFGIK
jgi:ribose transport system substrate-binding protein